MKKNIRLLLLISGLLPLVAFGQARQPDQEPEVHQREQQTDLPEEVPQRQVETDSSFQPALVDRQLEILLHPRSIEAHQVSPFVAENEGPFQLEGFPMLSSTELNEAQRNSLIDLLSDSSSYLFNDLHKLCYFLPEMGFVFNGEEDHLTILVSTQCDLLRLYYTGEDGAREFTTRNIDPVHARFQEQYIELFPNPPEVDPGREMESLGMQLLSDPVYYKVRSGEGWSHIALKASRQFGKKVAIKEICKLNNVEYDKAMQNKVFPLIGEHVIIGFK